MNTDTELGVLLKACSAGEEAALKSLYRLTSAHLFALVVRMVKVHAVAEDVLRDTYVAVWEQAATYPASMSLPLAWLRQIARQQARERMSTPDYLAESRALAGTLPMSNPELYYARLQQLSGQDDLPRTLRTLSPEARHMILLAYCDGMAVETLAEQQGMTNKDARDCIQKGLESLSSEENNYEN